MFITNGVFGEALPPRTPPPTQRMGEQHSTRLIEPLRAAAQQEPRQNTILKTPYKETGRRGSPRQAR
jgi:hypothetical protein